MADIQRYIEQFDDTIRLKRFDENATLREKRDVIIRKLADKFEAMRAEGKDVPTFESFGQGSYQLGTGIKPAAGNYDIDVGLRFDCASSKYPDPVALKILVADALEDHTSEPTEIRRSCVTVRYKQGGDPTYHVDLAVYACDDPNSSSPQLLIAKGKRNSDKAHRYWEKSDPLGLLEWVKNRHADEHDRAQFFRVIRAMKRWKTERFESTGNAAPSGIGLTIAAGTWFTPAIQRRALASTVTADDLAAMKSFVSAMLGSFAIVSTGTDGTSLYRLVVTLPVEPRCDLFERMSDAQMTEFRTRLIAVESALVSATKTADPVAACEMMQKEFGEEFPVPDKDDTGQGRGRAVTSAGVSA